VFTKLHAIKAPDTVNVRALCRESVTNQGKTERVEATEAPSPNNTSNEGRAQQSRVLREVNREK
jgi:hypothetical protein